MYEPGEVLRDAHIFDWGNFFSVCSTDVWIYFKHCYWIRGKFCKEFEEYCGVVADGLGTRVHGRPSYAKSPYFSGCDRDSETDQNFRRKAGETGARLVLNTFSNYSSLDNELSRKILAPTTLQVPASLRVPGAGTQSSSRLQRKGFSCGRVQRRPNEKQCAGITSYFPWTSRTCFCHCCLMQWV